MYYYKYKKYVTLQKTSFDLKNETKKTEHDSVQNSKAISPFH